MLTSLFAVTGFSFVVVKLTQFVNWVRFYFILADRRKLLKNLKEENKLPYAIVTGATSGIGLGFAKELAKRGFGVVLAARNKDKLEDSKRGIIDECRDARVITVVCNFCEEPQKWLPNLRTAVEGVDVAILVNNVGTNNAFPELLSDHKDKVINDMIDVNIRATTALTKSFVVELNQRKKGGVVLTLGSIFGRMGSPMLAVYSGTKAYAHAFSLSLRAEYKNVEFLAVNPGYVMSNMSKLRKESLTVISPKTCADTVLRQVSLKSGHSHTSTHWSHDAQGYLSTLFSDDRRLNFTYNIHQKINKFALKRIAKKEAEAKAQMATEGNAAACAKGK